MAPFAYLEGLESEKNSTQEVNLLDILQESYPFMLFGAIGGLVNFFLPERLKEKLKFHYKTGKDNKEAISTFINSIVAGFLCWAFLLPDGWKPQTKVGFCLLSGVLGDFFVAIALQVFQNFLSRQAKTTLGQIIELNKNEVQKDSFAETKKEKE